MRKVLRCKYAWRRAQKHGNSLCLTTIKGFFPPDWNISLHIHHFHIDYNDHCLRPKILHNHCFQFLLGVAVVPREIEDNGYAKFWRLNKVHYGLCENGELWRFSIIMFEEYSSETQGRSVGSGKPEAKVFKSGRKSPWNATLNEPVPLLIRILVCDRAQKIILCPIRGQQNFRRRFSWPNWVSEAKRKWNYSLISRVFFSFCPFPNL